MALAPGTAVGSYEVLELLGSGGMASVYRAQHLVLGSVHALKVLRSDLVANAGIRQRFLDEGRVQAQLAHPGVVRVTDLVSEPGVAGLVMDFLVGTPLDEELQKTVPGVERAVFWMLQILGTMEHAHTQGVVHRDLKPSNLFVVEDGGRRNMRVLDFGIAKILGRSRTLAQETMGTYAYMSPEQFRDPSAVDARSDIFALGAVLFEIATGRPAFVGATDYTLMQKVAAAEHEGLDSSGLPASLTDAIMRALSLEPADRFQTCLEFAAAIEGCATGSDRADLEGWRAFDSPGPRLPKMSASATWSGEMMEEDEFDELPLPSSVPPAFAPADALVPPASMGLSQAALPVRSQAEDMASQEQREMVVRAAGAAQILAGLLNVFGLWFLICWGLPWVFGSLFTALDLPWIFFALSRLTSLLGCGLFVVGCIEIISGVNAIAKGEGGRAVVQRTAFLEIAALGMGGVPSFLVGLTATGLLLSVSPKNAKEEG